MSCKNCPCKMNKLIDDAVTEAIDDLIREQRKLELWYKHMRNEDMTDSEIDEYGKLTGFLDD